MQTPIPHCRESEVALLGAALRDPDACREWIDQFDPEDFHDYPVRMLWRAVKTLQAAGEAVEMSATFATLRRLGVADVGPEFVAACYESVPTAANAAFHAGVVRDYALRRRIIYAALEVVSRANAISGPADEVLDAAREAFREMDAPSGGEVPPDIGTLAEAEFAEMELRRLGGTRLNGLSTGLEDLDQQLGGLKPGELTVIGARPSQGKTALGLGVALNVARGGVPVVLFSAEMPASQIAGRALAAVSGVSMFRMGQADLIKAHHTAAVQAAAKDLRGTPLFVDDRSNMNAARILRTARRVQREHTLAAVVVDYLQLLRAESGQRNRHEEVGTLALRMKQLARELSVPVILLSQLSRESERAGEPTLAHLKESGDIEAHADNVILIHRTGEITANLDLPIEVRLLVAKNRNGPVGKADVLYDRVSTAFKNKAKGY